MFAVDDYVVYGTMGICKVMDIRKEEFSGIAEKEYYILQPPYSGNATLYVPTDSTSITMHMRSILTIDEVYALIKTMSDLENIWINDEKLRNGSYNDMIKKGDRQELVKLIKTLHEQKNELQEHGSKLHVADEKILEAAEKMLYEEFALVLKIKQEDVIPFILGEIQQ